MHARSEGGMSPRELEYLPLVASRPAEADPAAQSGRAGLGLDGPVERSSKSANIQQQEEHVQIKLDNHVHRISLAL